MDEFDDELTPKKRDMKLPIVAVVCLLAGGAGGFFGAGAMPAGSEDGAEESLNSEVATLGEYTINLQNSGAGRVLQMTLSAEGSPSAVALLAERNPEIRDAIIMMASDYTLAQLDGTDNRLAFRDEIETRVDTILGEEDVDRIYFTDFVVQ